MIAEVAPDSYDAGRASGVRAVVEACDLADGVDTLDEQVRLELKHRGLDRTRLWVAGPDDLPDGIALLHGGKVDVAVRPPARGRGIGTGLARAAVDGLGRVEAWSHADDPAAARIAARLGVPRVRELLVMARDTSALPAPRRGADIDVRTYAPGDEEDLVRINAAAFAHHPDQGDMTLADFRDRIAEPWFDPAGLFLAADRDGRVLGFHWTKVHREEDPPYGEVYVVAVDPAAAGRGIGTLLTAVGVDHLSGTGVDRILLYVEGDNAAALAVYTGLGFTRERTEVQYAGPLS